MNDKHINPEYVLRENSITGEIRELFRSLIQVFALENLDKKAIHFFREKPRKNSRTGWTLLDRKINGIHDDLEGRNDCVGIPISKELYEEVRGDRLPEQEFSKDFSREDHIQEYKNEQTELFEEFRKRGLKGRCHGGKKLTSKQVDKMKTKLGKRLDSYGKISTFDKALENYVLPFMVLGAVLVIVVILYSFGVFLLPHLWSAICGF